MKKLINLRIPLLSVVGLILGIIACKELLCGDFYFGLVLLVLLTVGIVLGMIVKRGIKVFAMLLVCVIVGFGLAQTSYLFMEGDEVIGREVELQGRVSDLNRNGAYSSVYYLEDCIELTTGQQFRGKVKFVCYTEKDNEIEVGEVLTICATMYSTYPVKSSIESFYIRNRIHYELVDAELIGSAEGKLKFDERVRRYVYDVATEYAPNNGGIIYALLTGDRNAIDADVQEDFTRAGAIHVLAVSGLHVGFIAALLSFALRPFKLKPLAECGILLVPLLIYAYICGFTPSVTRAIVMMVCVYLSRVALGRYDLLTSLSISAIIVIFPTPYAIFDVGFQLSFLSIFGIATLHTPIIRVLGMRKLNRIVGYLLNAVVLSLSCSLATFFVLAVNFGRVPVLGVLVNLVAIPLISIIFVLSVFAMIPWVFHYLVFVADKLLVALVWVNSKVSSLSFATVSITALTVSVAVFAALCFIVGGFVNLNKLGKRIGSAVCALLLVATVLFAVIPSKTSDRVYVSYGYSGTVIAVTADNGEAALIGDLNDYTATANATQFLQRYAIISCTLFATDFPSGGYLTNAIMDLPIDKAYALTFDTYNSMLTAFDDYGVTVVYLAPNSAKDGAIATRSIHNGALAAIEVTVGEIDVCYVTGNGNMPAFELTNADIYVLAQGVDVTPYSQLQRTTVSRYQTNFGYNYGANKYGNFTITEKDDRIIFSFS